MWFRRLLKGKMHEEDGASDNEDAPCDFGEDDCVVIEKSSDDSHDTATDEQYRLKSSLGVVNYDSKIVLSRLANTETKINVGQSFSQEGDTIRPIKDRHPNMKKKGKQNLISTTPNSDSTTPNSDSKPSSADQKTYFYSNLKSCATCGKLGVPDSFYSGTHSKKKLFCTKRCVQENRFLKHDVDASNTQVNTQKTDLESPALTMDPPSVATTTSSSAGGPVLKSAVAKRAVQVRSFDWKDYLEKENAIAAPVSCFRHCPMSQCWNDDMFRGIKVEIINANTEITAYAVYWIAVVINVQGYGARVRYEGCEDDSSHDFSINLCSKDVHPVGWCSANVKPLVPPKFLQFKVCDWKEYLLEKLTGSVTLPSNFHAKVANSVKRCPFKQGMKLEVIDKLCLSTMSVATVEEVTGGRLKLRYMWSELERDFFFCHCLSSLIHPVGWSQHVGHKLRATAAYKTAMADKFAFGDFSQLEASPELFCKVKSQSSISTSGFHFEPGMKLEAVDPLNLSTICVATVRKVLRNGYLMIGIDICPSTPQKSPVKQNDMFCYHMSSPYIFPAGFCQQHFLRLTLPKGCKLPFRWPDYLKSTHSIAAPEELFSKDIPNHSFKSGMKLEAVDLMDPKLLCVATIVSVVGRLLKIHFDGWDNSYDQWMDCCSPDIYPLGWSDIAGHTLEGPQEVVTKADKKRNKQRGKKRKKHRHGMTSSGGTSYTTNPSDETLSQSTDFSQDFSDGQLSSPVAKRIKLDETKSRSVFLSPEPPSLVELSPRCDALPQLDMSARSADGVVAPAPRSMPNLLVSASRLSMDMDS